MREPLFDYLEEFYGKIRIFQEKNTGRSRADVIGVIDGQLLGFEIKSDGDSYTRLKTQTEDYDRLCDINYLVVGKSHRKQADRHIPAHWGILCVCGSGEDVTVELDQIPGQNPQVEIGRQLELLWRPELAQIQQWNELPVYKAKSKAFVWEKILEKVPQDILKKQITELLFERDYERLLEEIERVRKERAAAQNKRYRKKRAPRRKRLSKR